MIRHDMLHSSRASSQAPCSSERIKEAIGIRIKPTSSMTLEERDIFEIAKTLIRSMGVTSTDFRQIVQDSHNLLIKKFPKAKYLTDTLGKIIKSNIPIREKQEQAFEALAKELNKNIH